MTNDERVRRVISQVAEMFHDLDDSEDASDYFGDYARVVTDGPDGWLEIRHEREPFGVVVEVRVL